MTSISVIGIGNLPPGPIPWSLARRARCRGQGPHGTILLYGDNSSCDDSFTHALPMTVSQTEDAALVARVEAGDPLAAHEIYQRNGSALLRFGVAMTDCVATAEDVVHDTFVELLRHPNRYDAARGSLRTYLYGIARHHLAKALRIKGRYLSEDPWSGHVDVDPLPQARAVLDQADSTLEEQLDRTQAIERIRAAIRALPPLYREVVALCDMEDLPYSLVAEIIRCPIGTVRSRLHRARALLATELAAMATNPTPSPPGSAHACSCEMPETIPLALSAKGTVT